MGLFALKKWQLEGGMMGLSLFLLMVLNLNAAEISFLRNGTLMKKMEKEELAKSYSLEDFEVYDLMLTKNHTYHGLPLKNLMTGIFGENFSKSKKIVFIAKDGYIKALLLEDLAKLPPKMIPMLAFSEKNKSELGSFKKGKMEIPFGPLYLTWKGPLNIKDNKEHHLPWPYQVVKINLVDK